MREYQTETYQLVLHLLWYIREQSDTKRAKGDTATERIGDNMSEEEKYQREMHKGKIKQMLREGGQNSLRSGG